MWSVFGGFGTGDGSSGPVEKRPGTEAREEHPRVRRWAWALVLAFFVGGDLTTTAIGYATPGVMEGNPGILALLDGHGLVGMLILKAVVVLGAYLLYRVAPRPHDVGVPLGFGVVGVGVTGWNVAVLASVVLV